ncbi:MAG: hypothetical protein ACE37H_18395 [Phycisphaeraceae bacterium]
MRHRVVFFVWVALAAGSGEARALLFWDFDTGDGVTPSLNDWEVIANGDPAINNQPLMQVEGSERNRLGTDPVLGTSWDAEGKAGGFIGDGQHPPLIARSPEFFITEVGAITWADAGANFGTAPDGTAGSYAAGAQGLALLRASDGALIASVAGNDPVAAIDTDALGLTNDGVAYFLEAVDTRSGSWGYIEWDEIAVPGEIASAMPGDTDNDGDIDDTDLGTSFSNYTGPVGAIGGKTASQGDTDNDGDVDDTDLGTSFSGYTGPLSPANVPEPTGLVLISMGSLALVRRRRA